MSPAARPPGRAASAPRGAPSPSCAGPPDAFLEGDVHAVGVGDDLVLLDLPRGRYLCLSGMTTTADRAVCGPADRVSELTGAGLVSARPRPCSFAPRRAVAPARSLAPARHALSAATATMATTAVLDAALGYRGRSLAQLVGEAARRRAPAGSNSADALGLAARFRTIAPLLPLSAKCLLRSWLLLRTLRRAGHDAAWVFGVRTWPFRAHCWLQVDEVVLDDDWERVAGYAPILVA